MQVSASAYYDWRRGKLSKREASDQRLIGELTALHFECKQAYGARRLSHEFARRGRCIGKHRIARLKKKLGLWTQRRRRFVRTTRARPDHCVHPNRLQQCFHAQHPDEIWVSDVSAVWTLEGWLYLAVVIDLWSRKVVGWASAPTFDTRLTLSALNQALRRRRNTAALVHHSDRGAHYSSSVYQQRLRRAGIQSSMSGAGNCYDNAVAESFFSSLKNEETLHHRYQTRQQARSALYEYIEVFYNRKRLHSTIGYMTPVEFERQHRVN